MTSPVLTILVDNHASAGLAKEHGLAIWMEVNGGRILFDTGQNQALRTNAAALRIDLSTTDQLVLSHGHYDHTGAVDFVLQENPESSVYAHPQGLKTRYSLYPDKPPKEISMPEKQRLIIENLPPSKVTWIREPQSIAPGAYLTGPIPRIQPLEDTGGPFFEDPEGQIPDHITDDLAMWIETPRGLLVVCGCCHSGLINTLNYIVETSGEKRIWGIVGGLHLKRASAERLAATAEALNQFNPEFMVPCHCTGDAAIDYLKQHITPRIQPGFAGFKL